MAMTELMVRGREGGGPELQMLCSSVQHKGRAGGHTHAHSRTQTH